MQFNRKHIAPTAQASEQGHTFEPRFPDGTPIGATITVRGPESAAVRELVMRQVRDLQARELQAKRRGRELEPLGLEEMESQSIDLAVAYTITWEGFMDGDQVLAPSEANLRSIYRDYSYIRRQVIEEAQDLGNFAKALPKPCLSTAAPSSSST